MTGSAAPKLAGRADPVEVFTARCEARAHLWAEGEIPDLHEAVDKLQADAVRDGLVAQIGQDAVQAIMAKAFAMAREPWRRPLMARTVPDPFPSAAEMQKAYDIGMRHEREKYGVAEATLEAADWLVRQNDPGRLRKWLDGRSAKECAAILAHLEGKRCSPTTK